ncbi:MAG: thioredoxin domain-containing protein [Ferruginibacter sp.]
MSSLKPGVNPRDHQLGNAHASITLVEFGDYECPHCGIAHPLIQRLLKEFDGKINFVFRNFPLQEVHPHAYISALAAEAAGKQGKFWKMHDLIFENQLRLNNNFLFELAEDIQLDTERFAKDWKSKDGEEKVEHDFESGVRSGVNGTPGFFINGNQLVGYNETYESLLRPIESKLRIAGV